MFFVIIRPPYKRQNPSKPQNAPRNTPKSSSKTEIQKNMKSIRKSPSFVYFSYFFCISVLEEDLGCISGCILGCGGVLYFVWGRNDHKCFCFKLILQFHRTSVIQGFLAGVNMPQEHKGGQEMTNTHTSSSFNGDNFKRAT